MFKEYIFHNFFISILSESLLFTLSVFTRKFITEIIRAKYKPTEAQLAVLLGAEKYNQRLLGWVHRGILLVIDLFELLERL